MPATHRLTALSVVLTGRPTAADLELAGRVASSVAESSEVLAIVAAPDLAGTLAAAAGAARHEWLLVLDAADVAALQDAHRLVDAAPGHDMVAGSPGRLAAQRPRPRRTRRSHSHVILDSPPRRRAGSRPQDLPLLLLRSGLARRLGNVAGHESPAGDLAVLAVLLGQHVAIVRAGASAATPLGWRAPRAA